MQVGSYNKTTLGNIDNKKAAVVAKSEPGLRVQEFQGGRGLNIGALRIGRGFLGGILYNKHNHKEPPK